MANHSSVLAWKIPRTKEPSGLQSIGSQRVRYYQATEHTHRIVLPAAHAQRVLLANILQKAGAQKNISWLRKNAQHHYLFSSVQFSHCHVRLFAIPLIAAHQGSLSINNSRSLLKLTPIELVMPSSHLILCCPLLLLPPIPPSIRVFSNESTVRIGWPKYRSFSFSISPSNEHPGLISLRMDWLDLLAVQGTLKSLLQHHSSKASILRHSAFFTVQLSHP